MTVLVDTSVWVDFFNRHNSNEGDALARLIEDEAEIATCGVVLAEFFQGIRDRESLKTLEGFFRDMPLLTPREPDTYLAAAELYRGLRARGVSVRSSIDCLIVRMAQEADVLLLAKDRDINRIIESGLCKVKAVAV